MEQKFKKILLSSIAIATLGTEASAFELDPNDRLQYMYFQVGVTSIDIGGSETNIGYGGAIGFQSDFFDDKVHLDLGMTYYMASDKTTNEEYNQDTKDFKNVTTDYDYSNLDLLLKAGYNVNKEFTPYLSASISTLDMEGLGFIGFGVGAGVEYKIMDYLSADLHIHSSDVTEDTSGLIDKTIIKAVFSLKVSFKND